MKGWVFVKETIMSLVEILPQDALKISLAYATSDNFMGAPAYENAYCYLHEEAAEKLQKALIIAQRHGYGLHLFDAFRPSEAQWLLWERVPDPRYVGDPRKGSPHGRGVAIDLTLFDLETGQDLEMGTPFDDFTELSHHGTTGLTLEAERNRFMLLAIMSTAGWDFYFNEWWHYQLFNSKDYPLLSDKDAPKSIMGSLLTKVA